MCHGIRLGSEKKALRQILGIESGDAVKELMLGTTFSIPIFSIACPPWLIEEHYQNLEDQAEGFLVSDYNVFDLDLYLTGF